MRFLAVSQEMSEFSEGGTPLLITTAQPSRKVRITTAAATRKRRTRKTTKTGKEKGWKVLT